MESDTPQGKPGTLTSSPPAASEGAGDPVDAAVSHRNCPVPLSVLDLTVVGEGGDPAEALRHTAALAQAAEHWDYRRFWLAEHHSFPASASPAPPVILSHLADISSTIRLGSDGVMLTNHGPLVVAEQFGVLNAFHPKRVDLGVGRSPGGLPRVVLSQPRAGIAGNRAVPRRFSSVQRARRPLRDGLGVRRLRTH